MSARGWRLRLWPQSLAARTSLLLIVGLGVVQAAGLAIHAIDHVAIADRMEMHENQNHVMSIYRSVVEAPLGDRADVLEDLHLPSNFKAFIGDHPDRDVKGDMLEFPVLPPVRVHRARPDMRPDMRSGGGGPPFPGGPDRPLGPHGGDMPFGPGPAGPDMMEPGPVSPYEEMDGPGSSARFHHATTPGMGLSMLPPELLPRRILLASGNTKRVHSVSFLLPGQPQWLVVRFRNPASSLLGSTTFIIAFTVMTVCGGALIVWGTTRLIAPVRTLSLAAEALGRNVDAPPLPEDGPSEVRRAAVAFNTMASRIRRFVTDRTLMLTAIGHDLRTPITRLKLRAEFIDDDELRDKFLADLDEMESMVAATLAFGRDSASREPVVAIELEALLQTILDESVESRPDMVECVALVSERPVTIRARSLALKRALSNLVINALKYGGGARVAMSAPMPGQGEEQMVVVTVDDDGPGLPHEEIERMFEPFVRAESSRNRETGGTGLGLSIARTILRGQGGDVVLRNRPEGGLRAVVTLVV